MKPEKISSKILYAALGITVVVLAVFYFVGTNASDSAGSDFDKTSLLLGWTYFLFGLCIVASCIFFGIKFVQTFRRNPHTFWRNFLVFSGVLILFAVTWLLGSGEPIHSLNYALQGNSYFWLKLTDMFLYATYALLGAAILAIFGMYIFKSLKK